MTITPTRIYSREDWSSAFVNVQEELTNVTLNPARGEIPTDLKGTFYRNGPGRLERNGYRVHHPFDGDGMIAAMRFENGAVAFTNRFVRTEGWLAEEKAGKVLYRGVFGSQKPGGRFSNAFDLRLKNIANTNVVRLGDQLLALWEAAEPYTMDPVSLDTRGLSHLNGVLKKGESFSAHPRFDPSHQERPRMVTFGVKTFPPFPSSTIRLMEFATDGPDAGALLNDRSDKFPCFAFLHDFAITPNWAVFLQNSLSFDPFPFVTGRKGAAQCLASRPGGKGQFWLIPRDSGRFAGKEPLIIKAPSGFVFHHLNAFEEGNDIIIDSIVYDSFPLIGPDDDFTQVDFDNLPEGILHRCHLDLSRRIVQKNERITSRTCEFAMVNPLRQGLSARYAWMAVAEREVGNDPLQAIQKLDLITGNTRTWSAAPRGFVSEPLMVSRPGVSVEDDGWVLDIVWNGARKASDLVILDASDLSEVALFELPLAIPHGLHGSWAEFP
ncbi:carotenoid oxygenase family protein [Synechococcus sp. M16CYN]|uniref:carotenoid oxygenase family protein n=1 Tax=Synechococcus sp. M16CYN TaxID=3103139 RepID=UPI00325463AF